MRGAPVLIAVLALQTPGGEPLLSVARRADVATLTAEVRARPLDARAAIDDALAATLDPDDDASELFAAAALLADAYSRAWNDSFPRQEVRRFLAWTPDQRRGHVRSDSLRREGNELFARRGPEAAMRLWRRALVEAASVPDTAGTAAALGNLGVGFQRMDQADSAEIYLRRSRALAAAVGDRRVEANAIAQLAWSHFQRGDYEGARPLYDRALLLRQQTGDERGEAAHRNELGVVAQELGDHEAARANFEAALALNRAAGRDDAAAINLTNLGGSAAATGDPGKAVALYDQALATFRALRLDVDAADVLHAMGALELRRGNYLAARPLLAEALALYGSAGLPADAVAVRVDVAAAAAAMGDLDAALEELRTAERQAESEEIGPHARAGVGLARGDLAMALNLLADAEAAYALAADLYREAGDARGAAHARQGLGMLYLEADDFAAARHTLEASRQAHEAAGDARAAGLTLLWIAAAQLEQADTTSARALLRRAVAELAAAEDPVAEAAALGELGGLESAAGRPILADSLYAVALTRLDGRIAPDVRWTLFEGRGLTSRAAGNHAAAAVWLRRAVAEIEGVSGTLSLPERRSAYRADKWRVYAQLALTEQMRGRTAAAFEISERLRARETAAVIERAGALPPSGLPPELTRQEVELRRRIGELTRALEGTVPRPILLRGWDAGAGRAPVREALAHAQGEYARLLAEGKERGGGEWPEPPVRGWREVADRLAPQAALIEYLVSDSGVVGFVVTRDTLVGFQVPADRHELARLVEFARGTLTSAALSQAAAAESWRAPLRRLYHLLIAPAERQGLLRGRTHLVLVPHAELHYLPFAALIDQDRFLVEGFTLTYAPSASLWLSLGERRGRPQSQALLALAPRPHALPASREEVAAAQRLGGRGSRTLLGVRASEEAFVREAPQYGTVHVASFGVLNKHNPLFSFVELAPGGGLDGRLEVHEVLRMRLAADLIVLSACQTALGSGAIADIPPGDDWVGFTRAFLQAGAASVLATLWSVGDAASARLMEEFYRATGRGGSPADALAGAQRVLLRMPGATPFDWAGFALVAGASRTEGAEP